MNRGNKALQHRWDAPGRGRLFNFQAGTFKHLNEYSSRVEASFVKEYLQGARLLDIGAGTGRVASRVAMDGVSRVICLDPSMPMLSQIGQESPGDPGKLLPVAGLSMETLPFLNGIFDHVYSFGVLSHFENWLDVIKPVAVALKPGGRFLFNLKCENASRRWFGEHAEKKGAFQSSELKSQLASVGLRAEEVCAAPLLTGSILLRLWGFEREAAHDLTIFSVNHWLNDLLGRVSNIEAWVEIEKALSVIMPHEAALSSLILASRIEDRTKIRAREPDALRGLIREDFARDLSKVFSDPSILKRLQDPSVFRLLCLLGPMLESYAGIKDFLAASFQDRRRLIAETGREIAKAASPGFRMKFRKAYAECPVWMMMVFYALRRRMKRRA
jgi:SAM-dependent methyltransferase